MRAHPADERVSILLWQRDIRDNDRRPYSLERSERVARGAECGHGRTRRL